METITTVTTNRADGAVVRTTKFQSDTVDYSWLALALVAAALIAAGLRKLFWTRGSN